MKKISKVIQIILCILLAIIIIISIQRTYARYYEKLDTTYISNIKKWLIKVNNNDIYRASNLTEVMTPTFRPNDHVNANVIVPGSEGYFEFLIDYSNVDLAFETKFDFEQLNTTTVTEGATTTEVENYLEDFEIYGYSIVEKDANGKEVETPTVLKDNEELNGIIPIIDPTDTANTAKTVQLRILFRWNDANKDTADTAEKEGMNNAEDTQYAAENESLKYKIKVTFTQHIEKIESETQDSEGSGSN